MFFCIPLSRRRYDFYLFNNQTSGNVTVNVYMGPTLNYVPGRPLQYAVQIDEGAPQLVQPVPAAKDAGSVRFVIFPLGPLPPFAPALTWLALDRNLTWSSPWSSPSEPPGLERSRLLQRSHLID